MIKFILNLISTLSHKFFVAFYIIRFSLKMIWRGLCHDNSKLKPDEFKGYASVISNLANSTYGSANYETNKDKIKKIIGIHYSRNSHHPEHYENFQDMNLEDISEMFFDWVCAAKRHKNGNVIRSILSNQDRFGVPKKLVQIFLNTVRGLIGQDKYMALYEKAINDPVPYPYLKTKTVTYKYGDKEKKTSLMPCPNPDCCSDGLQLELCRNFDYVSCRSCGMHGPMFDGHPDDAIDGWNDLPRE